MKLRSLITCLLALSALSMRPSHADQDFWPETRWSKSVATDQIRIPDVTRATVVGIPANVDTTKAHAAAGLPTFSRYLVVSGVKYTFTLVGRDVFAARAKNVVIPVNIIPVRFVFPDGT